MLYDKEVNVPKYVGRHRRKPTWTPWKTISFGVAIAAILAVPSNPRTPEIQTAKALSVTTTHKIELPPPPPPTSPEKIPETPVEGGRAEFEEWVDQGMPGYIPDPGSIKNGNESEAKPLIVTVQATCEREPAWTLGLSPNATVVYDTICALFPEVTAFGGARTGDSGDHGAGNAIDAMVDPATGDALSSWLLAHWNELPLKYIIWQQRISYGGAWEGMEDRGSPTQNHMDHVHISVN